MPGMTSGGAWHDVEPTFIVNLVRVVQQTDRDSAELKGPRKLLRIRPGIFDFEPDLGLQLGQTKPNISGTVPTNWHTMIPNDSWPISACFDPTLFKL